MTLHVHFKNGVVVTIEHVAEVSLVGPYLLETRTFGNDFVTHRNVEHFTVDTFTFPN